MHLLILDKIVFKLILKLAEIDLFKREKIKTNILLFFIFIIILFQKTIIIKWIESIFFKYVTTFQD